MMGTLEARVMQGFYIRDSIHSLNHLDFFPDINEVKCLVILYGIKYSEKVAFQLVREHWLSWKKGDMMSFHIGWSENIPLNRNMR